jgi:putative transcriptional regulator
MTKSSLRERVGRAGAARGGSRVKSGTAVALNLRPDRQRRARVATIPAMEALVKRHVPLLRAKRAIEAMLDDGFVFVEVPRVEDVQTLARELRAAGVVARPPVVRSPNGGPMDAIDVAALRQRLGMTQEQFATVFQIALPVVRNWEQGRNRPDGVASVMLRMIDAHPKEVEALLWGDQTS